MSDTSVLFVCLGNICRSPTAQGVFEQALADSVLAGQVTVDSAGTAAYHLGKSPDTRATAAARQHGYRLEAFRARQVNVDDFYRFDWILAMDAQNLADLQAMRPEDSQAKLGLFLDQIDQCAVREVPDPYYGGSEGFEQVLDLCEQASQALLRRLEAAL
ncbi:phosphotyrosine protein phosphatase [Saccharospirillum sp. MSK14-1]|uniref:low molecular weight protein-tyrosine-phosphatase n=1 Tax=Saccharospirillum sp. MSK14-1 TaxID=1897632 RepID=UPI000D396B6E|nr:low molecular weight protein-tyrosine-phosphatase [Saccharospirillum sp. MSK14-1]PTY36641.1 phosphotyrosine protein phosphatase [Saccharospirillum sp. MSK14-1]